MADGQPPSHLLPAGQMSAVPMGGFDPSAVWMMQGGPGGGMPGAGMPGMPGMQGMPGMLPMDGGNGGMGGGQTGELQRARFRAQFAKTEMCRYYRSGCRYGEACPWAHGDAQIENRPDLTKTSLCRAWSKNACPHHKEECKFAHGAADLRVTPWYEKIAMCQAFKHGRCKAGKSCRFAHSQEELHMDSATVMPPVFQGGFGGGQGGNKGGKGGMSSQIPAPWMGDPSAGMPQHFFGGGGDGGDGSQPVYGMMPGGMMPGPMIPMMMQQGGMQGMMPGLPDPGGAPFAQPGFSQDPAQPAGVDEAKKDVQLTVKLKTGGSVKFKIKAGTPLRKLMDTFCTKKVLERSKVKFTVAQGIMGLTEIFPDDTANKLGLTDDSVITAEVTLDDDA